MRTQPKEYIWDLLFGGVCLVLTDALAQTAPTGTMPSGPPPTVQLAKSEKGELTLSFEGKTFAVSELAIPRTVAGVTFAPDETGKGLLLSCLTVPNLRIENQGFEGWSLRMGEATDAGFALGGSAGSLDVSASPNNASDLELAFADGGKAKLGAGATVRYEQFNDQSYYLAGKGKVKTIDADGVERALSPYGYPMTGGALKRYTNKKGVARWQRATPLTEVSISGSPGAELEIMAGPQKITLGPQDKQRVELPNGTVLSLAQNPNHYLDWKVEKGFCRFWVDGIQFWSATAVAGQSASMIWSAANGAVDVKNSTPATGGGPGQDVLIMIARRVAASIPTGAEFQYANLRNGLTFQASATGGEVKLYNPELNMETVLESGIKSFRNGIPNEGQIPQLNVLNFSWGDKASLRINGTLGDFVVATGGEQVLELAGKKLAKVNYPAAGSLSFAALGSPFYVQFGPIKEWPIEVREGDSFHLQFNIEKSIFIIAANVNNQSVVSVTTPDGNVPTVQPGMALTIQATSGGTVSSRTEGYLVFAEGGGAGVVNTYGSAPDSATVTLAGMSQGLPGARTTELHLPPPSGRILQEPVSVSGKEN